MQSARQQAIAAPYYLAFSHILPQKKLLTPQGMNSFLLLSLLSGLFFHYESSGTGIGCQAGLCSGHFFASLGWGTGGIFVNSAFSASGVATLETTIKRMTAVK